MGRTHFFFFFCCCWTDLTLNSNFSSYLISLMIDKKDLENLDYHSKNFILNRNLYLTENTLIGIIDESLRDEVM